MTAGTGRSAFVLGGTGSMGRAIVARLMNAGVRTAFAGRDRARGHDLATRTGALFYEIDVIQRSRIDESLEAATNDLGGIDLFVSAIGEVFVSPLGQTEEAVFRELVEVNLTSVFRCSRYMFEHFRSRGGGAMVHVVSDAALLGIHHIPVYTSAKAGLLAMSELFAAEGASLGIRVNAICPGATVPGVQSTVAGYAHHAEDHSTWGAPPSGRHGSPEDIASAVAWLAFGDSAHVSGATLRIDGAASAAMRGSTRA